MEKLSLYDLCIIAKSLYVDFGKLTYDEGNVTYLPSSSGRVEADPLESELSQVEYQKLSVLISVLKSILDYRPLPFWFMEEDLTTYLRRRISDLILVTTGSSDCYDIGYYDALKHVLSMVDEYGKV